MTVSSPAGSGHATHARLLALAAAGALIASLVIPSSVGAARPAGVGHQSTASVVRTGTTHTTPARRPTGSPSANVGEFAPHGEQNLDPQVSGNQSTKRVPADHVPAPVPQAVSTDTSDATGFDGLSHFEQRFAGVGTAYENTNFSTEPPDQGLCVGNGFVVEGVNSALAVYSPAGTLLAGPMPLNQLYGLAPEIIRPAPFVFGNFVGDVKCYYDPPTGRWFVTAFDLPTDAASGAFTDEAHVKLAVSKTSDPRGAWWIYDIDATDGDGTSPNHPHCPCFGDQPLIGADANGFYVTTNEYSLEPFGGFFNGAQVYAMSKAALISGTATVPAVHIDGIPLAEGIAYTLQPQTVPPGGSYESANGGTAYFLSALEFFGQVDNRIAIWALTNTASLNGPTPSVSLTSKVLASIPYAPPPNAEQPDGPTPLLDAEAAGLEGVKSVEHLALIAGNDDRMQQTVFADGLLWSNLNTVVKTPNGNPQVGTAWFVVQPSWAGGQLGGSVVNQGYVSVNWANVLYGSIGVNPDGDAVMGVTLVGRDDYPSAAYVPLSSSGPAGDVHVIAAGVAPEDGFTGYVIEGGDGVARWGDYSAAVADENGDIWVANEWITPKTRSLFANWGTFITRVDR